MNGNKKKVKSHHSSNKLLDYYLLIRPIGSGSFGVVYLAEPTGNNDIVNISNTPYVAIKVENRNRISRMANEYEIYCYLRGKGFRTGIPKIYDFIQTPSYNFMVIQLLGPSLEDVFVKHDREFTLNTTLKLAVQLITLLKNLHKTNFIHRDIKPSNFLIGKNDNTGQIYMMDFGLSKRFRKKGKHIKYRDGRSLIGTVRYASLNMHNGIEPSRRDDLESVGYMLVYFLKGKLPWQGLSKVRNKSHIEVIGEKKICTPLDILCQDLPECFKEYIYICRKLKFNEDPDYTYLRSLFIQCSIKHNINLQYQWINTISMDKYNING